MNAMPAFDTNAANQSIKQVSSVDRQHQQLIAASSPDDQVHLFEAEQWMVGQVLSDF